MADIAATDITVTIQSQDVMAPVPKKRVVAKLAFGNGTLTYPAGGIPVTIGKLGCPNVVEQLTVFDSGTSGYKWSYDRVNKKLVAIQGGSHTHDVKLIGGITATEPVAVQGGDTLGKNAATDRTIAGSTSASKGGIVANTAVAGSEPSTVAIAAQTLYVEVIGY